MGKLQAAAGSRAWSGRMYRMIRSVCGKYAAIGGSIFFAYSYLTEWMRHHDEANPRAIYWDHTAATTVLTLGATALYCSHPSQLLAAGFMSLMLVSPMSWWLMNQVRINTVRNPNIFYEGSCTKEEIERFRAQDQIEQAAFKMQSTPGYGYFLQNDPKGL